MVNTRRQKKIKNTVFEEEKKEEAVEKSVTKKEENEDSDDLEYFKDVAESEEESDSEESEEENNEEEEKDEFQRGDKVIALNPEDEEKIKNRVKDIKPENKENKVKPGVIFLSHIPHGFYEKQMKEYFTQFGEVTRLRLSRNKKTGKSKHYAFIEFKNAQVAEIVAETMNNYLLYSHVLKCSVIPEDKVNPNTFIGANKKFKVIPWAKIEREKQKELKSGAEYQKNVKRLLKRDEKKRKRLQEFGIDYEFSGYAAHVKKQPKHTKFE